MKRIRIVFSGSGGQGVITAAIILAEAAVVYDQMNATQSQSYGAEARGGATKSDVILSDQVIDFPVVTQPNILICLTQKSYVTYSSIIRPGGMLITDSRYVNPIHKLDARQLELPIYDTVMDKIGKSIVFNISVLGTLLGIQSLVREESVLQVVKERVPADYLSMNIDAFHLGLEIGRGV